MRSAAQRTEEQDNRMVRTAVATGLLQRGLAVSHHTRKTGRQAPGSTAVTQVEGR